MLPEIKESIILYLEENPGSSTRLISQMLDISIIETYEALILLEHRGLVEQSNNLTGTISFTWKISD